MTPMPASCSHRQHVPPRVALVDVVVWVLGAVAAVADAHGPAARGSQCLYRGVGPFISLWLTMILFMSQHHKQREGHAPGGAPPTAGQNAGQGRDSWSRSGLAAIRSALAAVVAEQLTCNPGTRVCSHGNVGPRVSYGQDWGSGPSLSLLLSGNAFYNSTIKRCLTFRAGPSDIVWREGGAATVLELLGHRLHGLR